ncbi:hypothetical protein [Sphingosinicella sp. BN140058]|uniref:hypothetical protein n=1 Tax=Sphingosinicella sp. BN140058 TaxID=1892855 RepID=UPI0010114071|nr:hypothetical protein [Sphingosinicella sp. BN140058]QAY79271.1 hypothetical protein ETR14_24065 [Sphingosinicella sp. BN140058]
MTEPRNDDTNPDAQSAQRDDAAAKVVGPGETPSPSAGSDVTPPDVDEALDVEHVHDRAS